MRYTCEIVIDRPRDAVFALYHDHEQLINWYRGFKELVPLVRNYGVDGSTAHLFVEFDNVTTQLFVTNETVEVPHKMNVRFECQEMWYRNSNLFIEQGNQTLWRQEVTYGFSGLVRIFAKWQTNGFKLKTEEKMMDFKRYAESYIPFRPILQRGNL